MTSSKHLLRTITIASILLFTNAVTLALPLIETETSSASQPKVAANRIVTFDTQLSAEPALFDAPNTGTSPCVRPLNPMSALVIEPTAGPTSSTGLLIVLTGINGSTDCLTTPATPNFTWADSKDLILAHVLYRNISFRFPYDFGKYQIVDVLRAIGALLETYPEIDRNRIYLIGSSGGGHLALQVLQTAPDLFAEVSINRPITTITDRNDFLTNYPRDPATGWIGNLGFPISQGSLTTERWNRFQSERSLRSPLQTFPTALANNLWDPLHPPIVSIYHGTADSTVDPFHSASLRAATINDSRTQNWNFFDVEGGTHSYNVSDVMAIEEPSSFLTRRPSVNLTIDYRFPAKNGTSWKVMGNDLRDVTLVIQPEASSVEDWLMQ